MKDEMARETIAHLSRRVADLESKTRMDDYYGLSYLCGQKGEDIRDVVLEIMRHLNLQLTYSPGCYKVERAPNDTESADSQQVPGGPT